MCALPSSFIAELKERVTLSDLIRPAIGSWDRKKSNPSRRDWWSPCPFHQEKSSSFHVDDNKGFYHCFGCGAHGSAIDWVMERQKLNFIEATKQLAEIAGMTLPEMSPEMAAKQKQSRTLYDVLSEANNFYRQALFSRSGEQARYYISEKRNLNDAILNSFGIGYAPNHRTAIIDALKGKGFDLKDIIASGLAIQPDDGRPAYDRFRDRIMFPVLDRRNNIITFGGRALSKEAKAKYLNGPETDIFYKSRQLYNLNKAIQSSNKGQILVCEGYMDVIALAKYGFDFGVAPMGTALTDAQIELLWKFSSEPILCFDGDKAGIKAAWRALEKLLPMLKAGYSAQFIFLPNGLDPDDFLEQNGKEAFQKLIDNAYSLSHVLFVKETSEIKPDTPERIAGLEKRLEEMVRLVPDSRLQELYRIDMKKRLEKITGVRSNIQHYNGQYASRKYKDIPPSHALMQMKNNDQGDSLFRLEARIIGLFIHFGHLLSEKEFEILSNFEPKHSAFDTLKAQIMQKYLMTHEKDIEKTQKIDIYEQGDRSNHSNGNVGEFYIQHDSYAFHSATTCLSFVVKNFYSHFIKTNQSKLYLNNLCREFMDMHHKMTVLKEELMTAERIFFNEQSIEAEKRLLALKKMYNESNFLKKISEISSPPQE